jgi:signal transduction histidine kinase
VSGVRAALLASLVLACALAVAILLPFGSEGGWSGIRPNELAAFGVIVLGLLVGTLWFERGRRQRAEMEARRYLATMAELDRRAAMGHLTASLAHELRQPLAAILRNSEAAAMLIASGSPSLEDLAEIVDDIRKDDKRADDVIRRVKTLLQGHQLTAESIDVNEVARDTVEVVAPDARARGARVQIDLLKAPLVVAGDRVHLQQVLLNIVLNSLDAMGQTPQEQRFLLVSSSIRNGNAELSVRDGGPGIPSGAMQRIFEPFFSTKADGMGMGLSIARSIVEAHHGRIVAENNVGRGAMLRVTLPLLNRSPKQR